MAYLVDAARYAAANARVHGLVAQLIPQALRVELLAAPDFPAVVSLLRQSWYAGALAAVDAGEPGQANLEEALWSHLAVAVRRPLRILQGPSRELLDWYWRRFEIENLKTILRGVQYGLPPEQFQSSLIPLGAASPLPWTTLAAADSVSAVVERLGDSVYAPFLAQAIDRYRREGLLFVLEVALDLGYDQRMLQLIEQLHGRDRREARRFLGTRLEADNLLWAYRYRIYAGFLPEEILNYTLQRGLKVDVDVVRAIALGAALPHVVRQVWGDGVPGIETLQDLPDREALPRLEIFLQRYLHALAQRTWRAYPLHLGTVLAYLVLVEDEMRDLMAIIEGKVFGWSAERLRPYLIGEWG
jgi:V/A-type H+-transporting ATPase subunit C